MSKKCQTRHFDGGVNVICETGICVTNCSKGCVGLAQKLVFCIEANFDDIMTPSWHPCRQLSTCTTWTCACRLCFVSCRAHGACKTCVDLRHQALASCSVWDPSWRPMSTRGPALTHKAVQHALLEQVLSMSGAMSKCVERAAQTPAAQLSRSRPLCNGRRSPS